MAQTRTKRSGMLKTEAAEKIFRLFIEPIARQFIIPEGHPDDYKTRMEMFFDVKNRDIWVVKCRRPFNIVGPRWKDLSTPEAPLIAGDGERAVKKGDLMWVRYDALRPDIVEVEFKEQNFFVRKTDWDVLGSYCDFIG